MFRFTFIMLQSQSKRIVTIQDVYKRQVMSFADDAAMQKKWKAFVRKINTKTDDYSTVLKTIQNFLEQPFIAAAENKTFTECWSRCV